MTLAIAARGVEREALISEISVFLELILLVAWITFGKIIMQEQLSPVNPFHVTSLFLYSLETSINHIICSI